MENKSHRVQLDFSSEAFEKLVEIKKKSGATTNAEVIRNALRLYEWFLQKRSENYKLQIEKDDVVKEVELMFLTTPKGLRAKEVQPML